MRNQKSETSNIKLIVILIAIVCLTLLVSISAEALAAQPQKKEPCDNSDVIENDAYISDIVIVTQNYPLADSINNLTDDELVELIKECSFKKTAAHTMAEQARALGYSEQSVVIQLAQENWHYYNYLLVEYTNKLEALQEEKLTIVISEDYPEAAKVWNLLKGYGYSDYVCAGIIGNIMVECGGGTLELQPYVYSKDKYYYGLCQWNKSTYKDVFGQSVAGQLEKLQSTIKYEIDIFGYVYKSGFNYESFCKLTDEKSAALAFAKTYERCGSGTYSKRQTCATDAYKYFVN